MNEGSDAVTAESGDFRSLVESVCAEICVKNDGKQIKEWPWNLAIARADLMFLRLA